MPVTTINSRNKGASAERELAGVLFDALGVRLVRNLDQCRGGGHDLVVAEDQEGPVCDYLNSFAIEVKRHQTATPAKISGWWDQAERQALAVGKTPLLAYRADRQSWRVVVPVLDSQAEIDLKLFIFMARECLVLLAA